MHLNTRMRDPEGRHVVQEKALHLKCIYYRLYM
jgi:hypothetical protein